MREASAARIKRLQLEQPLPQFGHAGRHRGRGTPECPREPHHHHDEFCSYPTLYECVVAGVPFLNRWGSRA